MAGLSHCHSSFQIIGYFISISTRQWSLGPHSLGSFMALTLTRTAIALDANTKSS